MGTVLILSFLVGSVVIFLLRQIFWEYRVLTVDQPFFWKLSSIGSPLLVLTVLLVHGLVFEIRAFSIPLGVTTIDWLFLFSASWFLSTTSYQLYDFARLTIFGDWMEVFRRLGGFDNPISNLYSDVRKEIQEKVRRELTLNRHWNADMLRDVRDWSKSLVMEPLRKSKHRILTIPFSTLIGLWVSFSLIAYAGSNLHLLKIVNASHANSVQADHSASGTPQNLQITSNGTTTDHKDCETPNVATSSRDSRSEIGYLAYFVAQVGGTLGFGDWIPGDPNDNQWGEALVVVLLLSNVVLVIVLFPVVATGLFRAFSEADKVVSETIEDVLLSRILERTNRQGENSGHL